jgi:hypothetical protein
MFRITDGSLRLFTFRDGILSSAGHDLRLTLKRFQIDLCDTRVSARFHLPSLVVDGAIIKGRLSRLTLVKKDREEIHKNTMGKKVLNVARHPEARLEGTVTEVGPDQYAFEGALEIVGREVRTRINIEAEEGRLRGEVTLRPSQWGIPPFSTLLGTMKIQDRVDVVFDLQDPRCLAASSGVI